MVKKKSAKGYTYYSCETGQTCGFMTWDVPTDQDCPFCGQTMFKRAGKGRNTPFCINEVCSNFLPEEKRGYYKKKSTVEASDSKAAQSEKTTVKKKASGKSAAAGTKRSKK